VRTLAVVVDVAGVGGRVVAVVDRMEVGVVDAGGVRSYTA
jgi:hypothetical protein